MSAALPEALEKVPAEERIRQRAYELYVERGYVSGYDVEDWLQAEQECAARPNELEASAAAG